MSLRNISQFVLFGISQGAFDNVQQDTKFDNESIYEGLNSPETLSMKQALTFQMLSSLQSVNMYVQTPAENKDEEQT